MPIPKEADFAYGMLGGEITTHYRWSPDLRVVEAAMIDLAGYLDDIDTPLRQSKEVLQADIQKRFDTETWPDGTPWRQLSYQYAQYKEKHYPGQKILHLRGPLEEAATADTAFIIDDGGHIFYTAANLPTYWELHQYGSEEFSDLLSKRESKRLGLAEDEDLGKIASGSNVPPRPFIGVSKDAEQLIFEVFDFWFYAGVKQTVELIEDLPHVPPTGWWMNPKQYYAHPSGTVQQRLKSGRFGPKVGTIFD